MNPKIILMRKLVIIFAMLQLAWSKLHAQVMVYSDADFAGAVQSLSAGSWDVSKLNVVGNDAVSSLKVPSGKVAILFENSENGHPAGKYKVYKSGNYNYVGDFNDLTSHIIILNNAGNEKVTFFDGQFFEGAGVSFAAGNYTLPATMDKKISSAYIPEGVSVSFYNQPPKNSGVLIKKFTSGAYATLPAEIDNKSGYVVVEKALVLTPLPALIVSAIDLKYNSVKGQLGNLIPGKSNKPIAGGKYSQYERGAIYSKDNTTAYALYGKVYDQYKNKSEAGGSLGFPVTDVIISGNVQYAEFENGGIYCYQPNNKTVTIEGKVWQKYKYYGKQGGVLGFPLPDSCGLSCRQAPGKTGSLFVFTGGSLVQTPAGNVYCLDKFISTKWLVYGACNSSWGFPVADFQITPGKVSCNFEHGIISYTVKGIDLTVMHQNMGLLPRELEGLSDAVNTLTDIATLCVTCYTGNVVDWQYKGRNRSAAIEQFITYVKATSPAVVGLTEVWDNTEKDYIKNQLRSIYPYSIEGPADSHYMLAQFANGGLLLLSKYPIRNKGYLIFPWKSCVGVDCISDKGALFAQIELPVTGPVNIFLTHMQDANASANAYEETVGQFRMLLDFVDAKRQANDVPASSIIMGDMNINAINANKNTDLMGSFNSYDNLRGAVNNFQAAYKGVKAFVGNTSSNYPAVNTTGITSEHGAPSFSPSAAASTPDNPRRYTAGSRIDHHFTVPGLFSSLLPTAHYVGVVQMPGNYDISDHYALISRYDTLIDYKFEIWAKLQSYTVTADTIKCISETNWNWREGDSDEPFFNDTIWHNVYRNELRLPTRSDYYDDVDGGEIPRFKSDDVRTTSNGLLEGRAISIHSTGKDRDDDGSASPLGTGEIDILPEQQLLFLNRDQRVRLGMEYTPDGSFYTIVWLLNSYGTLLNSKP